MRKLGKPVLLVSSTGEILTYRISSFEQVLAIARKLDAALPTWSQNIAYWVLQ